MMIYGTLVMKADCKMCKEKLAFGGTNGTRHLRRHMERCMNKNSSNVSQPIVGRTPNGRVYYFTLANQLLVEKL
ncbi:hypothetical protein FRX31_033257 [Thalictrum thalictroides]|uniref:BED-type domain-containing protein n=1 Tax=Thalictrum thalictroides TaxID=46969 RepID=A0A7J6UY85_THATH|nr:hypothetical protein FRX31_033257 [Thalictrum thalictroides]